MGFAVRVDLVSRGVARLGLVGSEDAGCGVVVHAHVVLRRRSVTDVAAALAEQKPVG